MIGLRGRLAGARAWYSDERRARLLAAATARDTTPPPPDRYGAYGRNTIVVPPARVTTPASIFLGDDVEILEHSFLSVAAAVEGVTPKLTVGDGTRMGAQAHIACVGEVEIAPHVLLAPRVFIADTYHRYQDPSRPIMDQPMAAPAKVAIGRGAYLGTGSAVLMGVTIGEGAYVAAGSVVTGDVEPHTLVAGNPARPVRRWDAGREGWVSLGPA